MRRRAVVNSRPRAVVSEVVRRYSYGVRRVLVLNVCRGEGSPTQLLRVRRDRTRAPNTCPRVPPIVNDGHKGAIIKRAKVYHHVVNGIPATEDRDVRSTLCDSCPRNTVQNYVRQVRHVQEGANEVHYVILRGFRLRLT